MLDGIYPKKRVYASLETTVVMSFTGRLENISTIYEIKVSHIFAYLLRFLRGRRDLFHALVRIGTMY